MEHTIGVAAITIQVLTFALTARLLPLFPESRAEDGASADVAILSNEQHAVWLRINDWVETDWHTFPQQGIISRSPLVIVVRPGNPLRIEDWADLARPGVGLVHADPRTSGASGRVRFGAAG